MKLQVFVCDFCWSNGVIKQATHYTQSVEGNTLCLCEKHKELLESIQPRYTINIGGMDFRGSVRKESFHFFRMS